VTQQHRHPLDDRPAAAGQHERRDQPEAGQRTAAPPASGTRAAPGDRRHERLFAPEFARPVIAAHDSRWWRLLLAGVTLLAALVVVTTMTGELPDGGWFIAMITMFTSFALIGAGVVRGIAGRFRSLPS